MQQWLILYSVSAQVSKRWATHDFSFSNPISSFKRTKIGFNV